jgi:hypothetical protein
MSHGRAARWLARAAVAIAVSAGLGTPTAAAAAAPGQIDPACEIYAVGGIFTVLDPAEAAPGLTPQIVNGTMSCIIDTGTQQFLVYLLDPFGNLVSMAEALAADGFIGTEVLDDDSLRPLDLAGLSGRGSESSIAIQFIRDEVDYVGLIYSPDATGEFGIGLFVIANPLIGTTAVTPFAGDGLDDPSTISNLRTIRDAVPSPGQGVVLVISAGLLTLLLAIPAFLLTKVLQSRYRQWFGWLERGRVGRVRRQLAEPAGVQRRWLFLATGMVLAALIAGFVDPRFGFNGLSVRLFLTLLATFALFNVGAWAIIRLVLSRLQPDARPTLTFHPATLLVVATAVLLSRMLAFDPGVIFGLVAGTTFAIALAKSKAAIVIIAGSGYAAVVAIIAWVAYSAMNIDGPPDNAALVSLSEFLGGVTLEGVSTLPIALIPLATLEGGILFAWRKWVWALCYLIGLALFMLVLFNLPGGDQPVDGGFIRWAVLFGVFAVAAVLVWLLDLLMRRRSPVAPAG